MASKGGASKLDTYKKLFKAADSNNDGSLSIQELTAMFKQANSGMSGQQIADTFIFFDGPKGDRRISFDEFCKGLDQIMSFMKKLEELFKEIDKSGDGFLDKDELRVLLSKSGRKFSDSEVNQILRDADKNCDNRISFQEFVDACT